MATFPEIPKQRILSQRVDGRGTRDAAALWSDVAARGEAIERGLTRVGGWAQAGGSVVTDGSTTNVGDFLLRGLGRLTTNELRVWVLLERVSGAVTLEARLIGATADGIMRPFPAAPAQVVISTGATQFVKLDITGFQSDAAAIVHGIRVTARGTGAGTVATIHNVSVIARPSGRIDGEVPPAAWPLTSIFGTSRAGSPDDVETLRRIARGQAALAGHAPRVLASRALSASHIIPPGGSSLLRYILPRGNSTSDVTIAFWAKSTAAPGLISGVDIYGLNEETGGLVPVAQVVGPAVASTVGKWYTLKIPAASWAANATRFIDFGVGSPGEPTGAGEVRAIVITEDEYDQADFFPAGEHPPAGVRLPATYRPGSPIVASNDGGSRAGQRTDRRTLASNTAWQGWRRSQVLAVDSPYAPVGMAGVSGAVAVPLWYGRHRLSRCAGPLEVWALVSRVGMANPSLVPRLQLVVDGVPTESMLYVPPPPYGVAGDVQQLWLKLETDWQGVPGVTYELELRAVWLDRETLTSRDATPDLLTLSGVSLQELPGGGGNLVPDNILTGTDALGTTAGFEANGLATLSSSGDESHSGKRSLKVETASTGFGVFVEVIATESVRHVASVCLRGASSVPVPVSVALTRNATPGPSVVVTVDDSTWLRVAVTSPDGVSAGDTIMLVVSNKSAPSAAGVFFVDTITITPT